MLNRKEIQDILQSSYTRENWIKLISSISNEPLLYKKPKDLELNNDIVKNSFELGSFDTSDGMKIGLYEIEIALNVQIERNRVGLRNLLRKQYKQVDGCFAVYTQGNKWRFSYISETREFENDQWIESKTEPKRFTYVLGIDEKVNTAVKRFELLLKSSILIQDIKDAFSVERVTKEFFDNIAKLFTQLTGGDRKIGSNIVHFKPLLRIPGTNNKKALQEFSIRLIGRLVFCWFLKKKVSSNGTPLIPSEILSLESVKRNSNYYHSILEELFFEALNTRVENRKRKISEGFYKNVPFLNGGLFEPNEDDYYKPSLVNVLVIPDKWFIEFFTVLENFNFTIDENTSIDIELSVDPEMLGRIFENLLAEINPETGESARKSTGSYYTPREIVEYMVDESLKLYLKNETCIDEDKLNKLISYSSDDSGLTKVEKKNILNAIDNVKILDPACGSGAFPIGSLQKMLLILQKIDPNSELWFEKMVSSIDDKTLKEQVKQKFKNDNLNFVRKFGLIQKCIYGVDLQIIAVELSKLRCFLTLVVDEEIDDSKYNRGIIPLPNLEFKFVAANTLIGLPDEGIQVDLFDTNILTERLQNLRNEYFNSSGKLKVKIENEFLNTQKELAKIIKEGSLIDNRAIKLANWNPFQNESSSWFEPEWMFGIQDGFDIIIGNPPYIFTRDADFSEDFKNYIAKSYFSLLSSDSKKTKATQSSKINLFALFILRGLFECRNKGFLTYIVPNNLLRTTTYDLVRKYLLENSKIEELVDLGSGIFEKVTAATVIFRISNDSKNNSHKIKIITKVKNIEKHNFITTFIQQNHFLKNVSYTFNLFADGKVNDLLNKISDGKEELGKYCDEIIEGIVAHKHLIIESNIKGTFPLIEGKTIRRYGLNPIKKFIVWNTKQIHRTRPDYLWNSSKKIIIQRISGGSNPLTATIDLKKYRTFASVNNLLLKPKYQNQYEYILALINSKIINWFYANSFSNNSELTVNISKTFLEKLPIVNFETDINKSLTILVKYVIILKEMNMDSSFFERLIDAMVYELYLPTEINEYGATVSQYLINLPSIEYGVEGNLEIISTVYKELSNPKHPISAALLKLLIVEEINIIEGLK